MKRVVKEYDVRQKEILDTALHLFFLNGYKNTTVNHIIQEIGIAKGTFYHYFKSKEDLLDRLIERFNEETLKIAKTIIHDQTLSAPEKFQQTLLAIRNVKVENIELMITLMRFLQDDQNIRFKHKLNQAYLDLFVPLFSLIIEEGKWEGTFRTGDPETMAQLILGMAFSFSDILTQMLLEGDLDRVEIKLTSYVNAIERLLGLREGTLNLIDRRVLDYFVEQEGKK